jgi:hypothetical protein
MARWRWRSHQAGRISTNTDPKAEGRIMELAEQRAQYETLRSKALALTDLALKENRQLMTVKEHSRLHYAAGWKPPALSLVRPLQGHSVPAR